MPTGHILRERRVRGSVRRVRAGEIPESERAGNLRAMPCGVRRGHARLRVLLAVSARRVRRLGGDGLVCRVPDWAGADRGGAELVRGLPIGSDHLREVCFAACQLPMPRGDHGSRRAHADGRGCQRVSGGCGDQGRSGHLPGVPRRFRVPTRFVLLRRSGREPRAARIRGAGRKPGEHRPSVATEHGRRPGLLPGGGLPELCGLGLGQAGAEHLPVRWTWHSAAESGGIRESLPGRARRLLRQRPRGHRVC
mmetsp:Transcript_90559/g.256015  ORF Transcript_90559/g.256015 Transcript_90559/m.256015 type:complete len:251 (+) Transcript_90559:1080-1832(+)